MNKITYQATRERIGSLDCVIVAPQDHAAKISALGVFCHGFGASGEDLVGLAGELLQIAATDAALMLVFPAAPLSLEAEGMPDGRAWWLLSIQRLISALEEGRFEQVRDEVPEGIEEARQKLTETIELVLQRCQLTPQQLLLGGFSQGAMVSVETSLRGLAQPPAELCLYSGALICERLWRPLAARLKDTRILQSHGTLDPVLPLQTGVWLRDMLNEAGCSVDFVQFKGPHTIPFQAIETTGLRLSELASRNSSD